MYVIDTNIFLSILLKEERENECASFLSLVLSGEAKALITDFLVDSIVIRLQTERKSFDNIRNFLKSLFLYKGLKIHVLSLDEKIAAINVMEHSGLDFDDSLQVQAAISNGIKEIVSFDPDFDKVKEIKRVEPKDII